MPALPPAGRYFAVERRYRKLASRYDASWGAYAHRTLKMALEAIGPGDVGHVLDVACGTGLLGAMLRERRNIDSYVGVDVSEAMLDRARARFAADDRFQWLYSAAERLDVPSGSMDLVTCCNAFHLVQDAGRALAEFHRVLRPGGRFVLVDWVRNDPAMRLILPIIGVLAPQHRTVRTEAELARLLNHAGFSIEHVRGFRARWVWKLTCMAGHRAQAIR